MTTAVLCNIKYREISGLNNYYNNQLHVCTCTLYIEDSYFIERKLYPNLDFYSGLYMYTLYVIHAHVHFLYMYALYVTWCIARVPHVASNHFISP
jgi:hypothetical protein